MSGGGAEGKGEGDTPLSKEPNTGFYLSQDPEISSGPWAEVRRSTDQATQAPHFLGFFVFVFF